MFCMGRPVKYDDAVKSRLLDEAASIVSSGGADALSVRGLAAAAETTTAAVYTLYGNRDGVLAALYSRAVDHFAASLERVPTEGSPIDVIMQLGRAYRAAALQDPHGYQVIFGGVVRAGELPADAASRSQQAFGPVFAQVERGQAAGVLRADVSAAQIAVALWALVHGMVSLELGPSLPPLAADPGPGFDDALGAVVRGWQR